MTLPAERMVELGRTPPMLCAVFLSIAFATTIDDSVEAPSAAPKHPNVLLVTLDTFRADRIAPWRKGGVKGGVVSAAPNLDALAAESLIALDAHAPAPLTLPAHTSMLTGLYPFAHGVRDNDLYRLDARAQTLPLLLAKAGYRTEAVLGATVLRAAAGLDHGFEKYIDLQFKKRRNVAVASERTANEVTDLVLERLAVADPRPWFLWAHYFDAHSVYRAPGGPPETAPLAEQYDAEVRFLDGQLARVIDRLKTSGALADTWIVVCGDHGEGLGIQQELAHAYLAEEGTLRIPLFVRAPDGSPESRLHGELRAPTSSTDVFPTILAIAGLAPPYAIHGRDLQAAFAAEQQGGDAAEAQMERPLWFETWAGFHVYHWAKLEGVIAGGFKYTRNVSDELFDVRDPAAPELEKQNLATERPEIVRALKDRKVALESEPVERFTSGAPALPLEEVARLRELGYLARSVGDDDDNERGDLDPRVHYHACADVEYALDAAKHGDVARAVFVLNALVKNYPGNPIFRETLGSVCFAANRRSEAQQAFESALALDPALVTSSFYLGVLALQGGDLAEAKVRLERTVALSPVHLEAWLQLRVVHDRQRDYAAVLRDSVEVVRVASALHDADGDAIALNSASEWIPNVLKRLANEPRRAELVRDALARLSDSEAAAAKTAKTALEGASSQ